jgi:ankyrin repeat protein
LVAHKLYQIEACRERYAKTLNELMSEHWDEKSLLAETQRIEAMLKPHLGPSQLEHRRALEGVRKFIRSRRADLLAEMSDGMPVWTRFPEAPPVIPAAMAKSQDPNSIWNAAKTGNIDGIKSQLAEGTDVDARDFTGATPLSIAAVAGQAEASKFLIGKGADIDVKSNDNQTPLHGAAFLGRVEIVQLFIENGVQVNARNNDGATPLDNAAAPWNREMQGIVEFIAGILQVKIDVTDVQAGRPEVAALLRKHGGKSGSELPKPTGDTIWASAKLGNLDALMRNLAEDDADPNAHDDKGITPLSWAAMAGQTKAVELLIKEGAQVDGKNRDGATSLHSAAFLGHLDVVELLIKNKAQVNSKNNMGQTPLATVAMEWNEEIKGITQFIASFLKLKVDVGKVEAARPKIAKLLRKHGGKTGAER